MKYAGPGFVVVERAQDDLELTDEENVQMKRKRTWDNSQEVPYLFENGFSEPFEIEPDSTVSMNDSISEDKLDSNVIVYQENLISNVSASFLNFLFRIF